MMPPSAAGDSSAHPAVGPTPSGIIGGAGAHLLTPMAPEQEQQVQAQVLAYKYISRGLPVPPNLQLAAAGAQAVVPPTALGITGEPVPVAGLAQQQGLVTQGVVNAAINQARETGTPSLAHRAGVQARRQLMPRSLPHGMALQQMLQAREARIRLMMSRRIEELSGMYANIPNDLKLRALIELKALRLVEFQRKVRRRVGGGGRARLV